MKKLFCKTKAKPFLLLMALLFTHASLKAQWDLVNTTIDTLYKMFDAVYFTNDNTGYVVGGQMPGVGLILKTNDGGINWDTTYTIKPLRSVHFPTPDTGYAVGYQSTIMKTTDAGANWVTLTTTLPFPIAFRSVFFTTAQKGFICSGSDSNSYYAYTTDGGATWATDSTVTGGTHIHFPSQGIGYLGGYKTTNGGANWSPLSYPTSLIQHSSLSSINFANDTLGFMAGMGSQGQIYGYDQFNYGVIIKTLNGANTWERKDYPKIRFFNSIQMVNADTGYAVGTGNYNRNYIYKTEDGGENWHPQELFPLDITVNSVNYYPDFFSVHCPSAESCFAVGRNGMIYKTTNGGGALIGVGINEKSEKEGITVYPNPTSGNVALEFYAKGEKVEIAMYDLTGRKLFTVQPGKTNRVVIDVSAFTKGMYLIQLTDGDNRSSKKLIIH